MKKKKWTFNFGLLTSDLRKTEGFSLIETLVAISILVVAVAGPLTIAHQGLAAARSAKNQITATYLAQDAIEYVRNVRDENNLSGRDWRQGILGLCRSSCIVDSVKQNIRTCSGSLCPVLRRNEASGLYGQSESWEETAFTREISVIGRGSEEMEILVDVSWQEGAGEKSISIRESIFDWQR